MKKSISAFATAILAILPALSSPLLAEMPNRAFKKDVAKISHMAKVVDSLKIARLNEDLRVQFVATANIEIRKLKIDLDSAKVDSAAITQITTELTEILGKRAEEKEATMNLNGCEYKVHWPMMVAKAYTDAVRVHLGIPLNDIPNTLPIARDRGRYIKYLVEIGLVDSTTSP